MKYAVLRLGLVAEARLPLVPFNDASKKAIDAVLAQLGLLQAKAAE